MAKKKSKKKNTKTVNNAQVQVDNTTESFNNIQEVVSKENASDDDTLMDFSKIDDEYKGELRRTLTPKERFFRTCEKFGDLFILNLLFTLTSIPIVTMGASFTAMYTVTLKMVRNEDAPIKDSYFKAFKSNFKQATQLWVGLLIIFYLIYLQFQHIFSTNGKSADILVMVLGLELLALTFTVPLLFPLVARYENTNLNMIKNSLLASILHLGTWATVFFLWMIPVMLYYLKEAWLFYTWYLWLVFLAAFVAYTCSYRLRSLFDQLEAKPEDDTLEDNTPKDEKVRDATEQKAYSTAKKESNVRPGAKASTKQKVSETSGPKTNKQVKAKTSGSTKSKTGNNYNKNGNSRKGKKKK